VLLIQGMHFKIVVGEDILDIIEEFEGENDQSDDEYEVETSAPVSTSAAASSSSSAAVRGRERGAAPGTAPGDAAGVSRKSSKPISKSHSALKSSKSLPSPAPALAPVDSLDDQSLEGEVVATTEAASLGADVNRSLKKGYTMLPLRSSSRVVTHRLGEVTLDHIKLDRTWLFDDIENLSVYRIAKKPIHSQALFQVSTLFLSPLSLPLPFPLSLLCPPLSLSSSALPSLSSPPPSPLLCPLVLCPDESHSWKGSFMRVGWHRNLLASLPSSLTNSRALSVDSQKLLMKRVILALGLWIKEIASLRQEIG
jgi:hypothetical protein